MRTLRTVSGALAVVTLATALTATAADARDHRRRGGMSPGAAAVVGAMGGLAVGTIIGSANRPAYAAPAPVYGAAPVYMAPQPVYEPVCTVERRREWVPGWGWQIRERTVCD
jgi:hypothetical protein